MEIVLGSAVSFLDVLVVRKGTKLTTKFYEKLPTMAGISTSILAIRHI
jgi:hypothetical protein